MLHIAEQLHTVGYDSEQGARTALDFRGERCRACRRRGNVSFRHLCSMEMISSGWVAFRVGSSVWERVCRVAVGGVSRRAVLELSLIVHASDHWILEGMSGVM